MITTAFDVSVESVLWTIVYLYMAVELAFYILFHLYMVPKANEWIEPQPYRDYGKDRCGVLFRIINRALRVAKVKGIDKRTAMRAYVYACFDPIQAAAEGERNSAGSSPSMAPAASSSSSSSSPFQSASFLPSMVPVSQESMSSSSTSSSSSSSSSTDDNTSIESTTDDDDDDDEQEVVDSSSSSKHSSTTTTTTWEVDGIGRDDMEHLFSWALFGRPLDQFAAWERTELQRCFDEMEHQLGMVFPPGSGGRYKARCLSFENVSPLHRPLFVYLIVLLCQMLVGLILRAFGYQRVCSKETGLTGWYRPARDAATTESSSSLLPLVFFHGIAPGGLYFYLPFVLFGLVNDGRASFLFEIHNISCRLGFHALTEAETIDGVAEIVDEHLAPDQGIALVGHSFGSVPLTWLLRSAEFRDRIRQFVLLDPVTILLSKPDVMVNFLYKKGMSKIRMLAGSELFTEWYLRRHFFFYNSELWLDDVPPDVQPIIALSEKDEIVNAYDVKDHLEIFATKSDDPANDEEEDPVKLFFWKGVPHAACVTSITKWREIKAAMLQQELALVQNERR